MVATTDCVEKSKPIAGNKVSKPLMEKKRRARINKCLDQLKSLLESYYSTSIRKRKLEKADILELTVKHLRNLQKIQSLAAAASEFSDYQSGFRSCLANVTQYLRMADNLTGSDRWMLSQLSSKLRRSGGREEVFRREEVFSTMDSGPEPAETSAAAPEARKATQSKALNPHSADASSLLPSEDASVTKQLVPVKHTHEKSPSNKMVHAVSHRNDVANTHHNVWRPW
ncbi:hairy-related 3 [Anoplopoma fimbria]|uniref:hairy-related 3 n=1 Tax=Anoplopoma fimbria TaxID=229290 RepID=UPI0023EA82D5|nr:hairy-related 3 [Anoplopoma fimbria]